MPRTREVHAARSAFGRLETVRFNQNDEKSGREISEWLQTTSRAPNAPPGGTTIYNGLNATISFQSKTTRSASRRHLIGLK